MSPHISVVIPVYKAENCLDELYARLITSLTKISEDFEIILIEDCGDDGSWQKIENLSKQDARVKGIQFSRNFGQHYGITAGIDICQGDWTVVMDCDLQDRPEEIPQLYKKASEGFDIVLARRGKRSDSLAKRVTSAAFYKFFSYLADIKYDGQIGNFRIISKKVVINLRSFKEQLRFFGGLVTWMGFSTGFIDVKHDERFEGNSSYSFKKLWKLAGDTIIAYSDKPLRLAIRLGFLISTFSFIYGVYTVFQFLMHGSPIAGWSSVIVSLYLLGGIIISLLGVIGIYLGKTFDETKRRPLYIIDKKTYD